MAWYARHIILKGGTNMNEVTEALFLNRTGQAINESLQLIAKKITGDPKVYGMRIKYETESSPASIVKYLGDAIGLEPAHMDYANDAFDYGSMGDLWFIRDCKPCILGQNGAVQAYLDKNDYTKNTAGESVTIDNALTGANVMVEFPKIWMKIVPFGTDNAYADVYFSEIKADEDFQDYAYIDHLGIHKEHFYLPAYNGSIIDSVMRSVSGVGVSKSKTAQQEIDAAVLNGAGWYTELMAQIQLVNMLLLFIGKSTDTQATFGHGITTGAETAFNNYVTGAGNTKGLFWGDDDETHCVKVFGIENWWGLQWRRYGGHLLINGATKVKLSYNTEDGSTGTGYNLTGDGYKTIGMAAPSGTSGGYISKMYFDKLGAYPSVMSGSSSTYFCDASWYNNSGTRYPLRGADSNGGAGCGAFACHASSEASRAGWYLGASLSYV